MAAVFPFFTKADTLCQIISGSGQVKTNRVITCNQLEWFPCHPLQTDNVVTSVPFISLGSVVRCAALSRFTYPSYI